MQQQSNGEAEASVGMTYRRGMDHMLRSVLLRRAEVDDWSSYPFSLPVLRNFGAIHIRSNVCFLAGENGTGKSTLLEAIAVNFGFGPQGGSKHFAYGHSERAGADALADRLQLVWEKKPSEGYFLRAESFFNIATFIDDLQDIDGRAYEPYGGQSLHVQSHGEAFLSLFKHRFSRPGLYILDEPEAALSPQRQLAFLVLLHQLTAGICTQFLISTHSPILLAFPGAQIFSLDSEGLEEVTYQDTESYQIMSGFISAPELYMKRLLE